MKGAQRERSGKRSNSGRKIGRGRVTKRVGGDGGPDRKLVQEKRSQVSKNKPARGSPGVIGGAGRKLRGSSRKEPVRGKSKIKGELFRSRRG